MWELLSPTEIIPTYAISYRNTNNTQCFSDSDTVTGIAAMQYTLRNIQEATEYSITVSGILSNGEARDYLTVNTLAAGQQLYITVYKM